MSPSLEYLERCAGQTGYQVSALEKVVRLGELAGDIARHPFLGNALLLKGGTALNLCFGTPSRLSVDLDFNYVAHLERENMLADRPRIEQDVARLAQRHGYRVQKSADSFAGRKLYLSYISVLGPRERIEVDVNFLFRLPFAGIDVRTMWQPGELEQPLVRVVGLAELVAGKMLALLDRAAARDAWDVGRLPAVAGNELASGLFRSRFIALSAILEHPLPSYTLEGLAKRLADPGAKQQLSPFLAGGDVPPATLLLQNAWDVVRPFLVLRREETEFLEAVNRGQLRPELLFPDDPQEAGRIASHPAILWKITNVRSLPAKRKSSRA